MVRLKGEVAGVNANEEVDFNSKMVRLKVIRKVSLKSSFFYFNSKMVRLKAGNAAVQQLQNTNFNSKMVRLKAKVVS